MIPHECPLCGIPFQSRISLSNLDDRPQVIIYVGCGRCHRQIGIQLDPPAERQIHDAIMKLHHDLDRRKPTDWLTGLGQTDAPEEATERNEA